MKTKIFFLFLLFLFFFINTNAQENENQQSTQNFTLSADFVTNYLWRGLALSDAPNIQPTLAYTNNKGNFSVGGWGSYSLSDFYSEVDFFVSYTAGNFTFSVWDYFVMTQQFENHFFDYRKVSTGHALEGVFTFNGPESFPLQITAATFFYGADKDANGDNYYSTYIEFAYPFKWKANNLSVFAGITPMEGMYGSEFAMNNLGISNQREIRINDKFSIPIKGSIIFNPHLENVYFVLTITLAAND